MKHTLTTLLARCSITGQNDCWVWTGGLVQGYGQVSWHGRNRRAHRLIYELTVGDVDARLDLDHLCRVRVCCNPLHLDPVTRSENLRRSPIIGLNNGCAARTHCRHGHAYDDANTYVTPSGARSCRMCNKDSAARTQRVRIERAARRDA